MAKNGPEVIWWGVLGRGRRSPNLSAKGRDRSIHVMLAMTVINPGSLGS
jgi:hypothetical protein